MIGVHLQLLDESLDGCLIEMVEYKDHKLKGSEWHSYPMPMDWCRQMNEYGRNK